MTNEQSPSQRFHILDGARGFAAIGIVLFHVFFATPLRYMMGLYVLVDFFFVLSGFVLYPSMPHNRRKFPRNATRFILTRIVRLWPMLIAALIVSMGLYWWKQYSASKSNSFFDIDPNRSPLLLGGAFSLLQILIPLSGAISNMGPIRGWEALGRALIGFGIGSLVRANLKKLSVIRNDFFFRITIALTIWAFVVWNSYTFTHLYLVSPLFGLIILQLSRFNISISSTRAKVCNFLGRYSYGVYAFHILALEFYDYNVVRIDAFAGLSAWWKYLIIKSVVVLLVSTLATFLTLKLIDQPLQRRGRALIKRKFASSN